MHATSRSALILGLTALAFHPTGLAAQNTLGIRASVISANFTGDGTDQLDSRTAIGLSAWLAIPINERFNFVPGLAFAPKGYSATDAGEDFKLKLNYIEIPLLVSIPFAGGEGATAFSLFAGPSIAFEVGCRIGSDDCGDDDSRKKFDVGVAGGVAATIPVNDRFSAFASVGIDLGLTNLDEDPGDSIKNRAFFLSVGAAIPLNN